MCCICLWNRRKLKGKACIRTSMKLFDCVCVYPYFTDLTNAFCIYYLYQDILFSNLFIISDILSDKDFWNECIYVFKKKHSVSKYTFSIVLYNFISNTKIQITMFTYLTTLSFFQRAFCVGKPCSIDPGMRCTASARRFFPLLRWYCIDASHKTSLPAFIGRRQRFVKRDGFLCRWIKYLHPITTQCACQCKVWRCATEALMSSCAHPREVIHVGHIVSALFSHKLKYT